MVVIFLNCGGVEYFWGVCEIIFDIVFSVWKGEENDWVWLLVRVKGFVVLILNCGFICWVILIGCEGSWLFGKILVFEKLVILGFWVL